MHWKRENVNPMLILRNTVCNERWEETWQIRMKHQQQSQKREREEHIQTRLAQAEARLLLLLLRCSSPKPRPMEQATPPAVSQTTAAPTPVTVGPRRPAATHPWRRACVAKPNNTTSTKL